MIQQKPDHQVFLIVRLFCYLCAIFTAVSITVLLFRSSIQGYLMLDNCPVKCTVVTPFYNAPYYAHQVVSCMPMSSQLASFFVHSDIVALDPSATHTFHITRHPKTGQCDVRQSRSDVNELYFVPAVQSWYPEFIDRLIKFTLFSVSGLVITLGIMCYMLSKENNENKNGMGFKTK